MAAAGAAGSGVGAVPRSSRGCSASGSAQHPRGTRIHPTRVPWVPSAVAPLSPPPSPHFPSPCWDVGVGAKPSPSCSRWPRGAGGGGATPLCCPQSWSRRPRPPVPRCTLGWHRHLPVPCSGAAPALPPLGIQGCSWAPPAPSSWGPPAAAPRGAGTPLGPVPVASPPQPMGLGKSYLCPLRVLFPPSLAPRPACSGEALRNKTIPNEIKGWQSKTGCWELPCWVFTFFYCFPGKKTLVCLWGDAAGQDRPGAGSCPLPSLPLTDHGDFPPPVNDSWPGDRAGDVLAWWRGWDQKMPPLPHAPHDGHGEEAGSEQVKRSGAEEEVTFAKQSSSPAAIYPAFPAAPPAEPGLARAGSSAPQLPGALRERPGAHSLHLCAGLPRWLSPSVPPGTSPASFGGGEGTGRAQTGQDSASPHAGSHFPPGEMAESKAGVPQQLLPRSILIGTPVSAGTQPLRGHPMSLGTPSPWEFSLL